MSEPQSSAPSAQTPVPSRRVVSFPSLDDLDRDLVLIEAAHRSGSLRHMGARRPGPILMHLATSIRGSLDGMPELTRAAPLWLRLVGPMVKGRVLSRPLNPGVRMSPRAEAALWNDAATVDAALTELRAQLSRLKSGAVVKSRHPIFGRMTPDEWTTFHLRHAELHLSFLSL